MNKKTILLTNHYPKEPLDIVMSELPEGFELKMLEENSQENIEKHVPEADYILASGRVKINSSVLEKAKKLKMIQRTGVGLDSLDLEEIEKLNIPLYVNQGVNAESVAEHTILLILACLRKVTVVHQNTRNGIWKKQQQGVQTFELAGKIVGLIGMGNIAKNVVRLLKAFNANILYYDLNRIEKDKEKELGVTYCSIDEILCKSDIISLHCPLTESTKHIINESSIEKMKNGAVLVNTARGGLVNTKALVAALNSGHVSYAGLDVHEEEPLPDSNEIRKCENVILTPHIGGVTYDSFRTMMHDAMRNIQCFEQEDFNSIAQYLYKRR